MITKMTAASIAYAYSEIEAAEALLTILESKGSGEPPDFRDAFGRPRRGIQLGVPSGESGHRLFDVSPALAVIIIKAHINAKRSEIAALCAQAVGECHEDASSLEDVTR